MSHLKNKMLKVILTILMLMTQFQPVTVNAKSSFFNFFKSGEVEVTFTINFLKTPNDMKPQKLNVKIFNQKGDILSDINGNYLDDVEIYNDQGNFQKTITMDYKDADDATMFIKQDDPAYYQTIKSHPVSESAKTPVEWMLVNNIENGGEYMITDGEDRAFAINHRGKLCTYPVRISGNEAELTEKADERNKKVMFYATNGGTKNGIFDLYNKASNKYLSFDYNMLVETGQRVPIVTSNEPFKNENFGFRKIERNKDYFDFITDKNWGLYVSFNQEDKKYPLIIGKNNAEDSRKIKIFKNNQEVQYKKSVWATLQKIDSNDHVPEDENEHTKDHGDIEKEPQNEYSNHSLDIREKNITKVHLKQEFNNVNGINEVVYTLKDRKGNVLQDAVTGEFLSKVILNNENGFETYVYLYSYQVDDRIQIHTNIDKKKYYVSERESEVESAHRYQKATNLQENHEYCITDGVGNTERKGWALGTLAKNSVEQKLYPVQIENNQLSINEDDPVLFTGFKTDNGIGLKIGDNKLYLKQGWADFVIGKNSSDVLFDAFTVNDDSCLTTYNLNVFMNIDDSKGPLRTQYKYDKNVIDTVVYEKVHIPMITYTVTASSTEPKPTPTIDPDKPGENTGLDEEIDPTQNLDINLTNKAINRPGTDTYDVSFGIKGSNIGAKASIPLDVVLIMDHSSSMDRLLNKDSNAEKAEYKDKSRWGLLSKSLNMMFDDLDGLDINYSFIGFDGRASHAKIDNNELYKDAKLLSYWQSSPDEIKNYMEEGIKSYELDKRNKFVGAGTNYESAFDSLKYEQLLKSTAGRRDAKKVVLFVTDGAPVECYAHMQPTDPRAFDFYWRPWFDKYNMPDEFYKEEKKKWYDHFTKNYKPNMDYIGSTVCMSNPEPKDGKYPSGEFTGDNEHIVAYANYITTESSGYIPKLSIDYAKQRLATLKGMDMFYTIGVGKEISGAEEVFKNLKEAANANEKENFYCGDEAKMNQTFTDIAKKIKSMTFDAQGIVVEYPLSEYCEPNGSHAEFKFTMKNESTGLTDVKRYTFDDVIKGIPPISLKDYGGKDGDTVTLSYDKNSKTVKLSFSKGYKLAQDGTFKVDMELRPSTSGRLWAKKHVDDDNNGYVDEADKDTGTYSSQKGLFVNKMLENGSGARLVYTSSDGKKHASCFPKPVMRISQFDTIYVSFKATKEFVEEDNEGTIHHLPIAQNQFLFSLKDKNGRHKVIQEMGNTASDHLGIIYYDPIPYSIPGIYKYTMNEVIPKDIDGEIVYDLLPRTVIVTVTTNDSNLLEADVEYKPNNAFRNKKGKTVNKETPFRVVLKGMRLSKDLFKYELVDEHRKTVVETVGCNADGKIVFTKIEENTEYIVRPVIYSKNSPEFIEYMHYDGVTDYDTEVGNDNRLSDTGKEIKFYKNSEGKILKRNNTEFTDEEGTFVNTYQIRAGIE